MPALATAGVVVDPGEVVEDPAEVVEDPAEVAEDPAEVAVELDVATLEPSEVSVDDGLGAVAGVVLGAELAPPVPQAARRSPASKVEATTPGRRKLARAQLEPAAVVAVPAAPEPASPPTGPLLLHLLDDRRTGRVDHLVGCFEQRADLGRVAFRLVLHLGAHERPGGEGAYAHVGLVPGAVRGAVPGRLGRQAQLAEAGGLPVAVGAALEVAAVLPHGHLVILAFRPALGGARGEGVWAGK